MRKVPSVHFENRVSNQEYISRDVTPPRWGSGLKTGRLALPSLASVVLLPPSTARRCHLHASQPSLAPTIPHAAALTAHMPTLTAPMSSCPTLAALAGIGYCTHSHAIRWHLEPFPRENSTSSHSDAPSFFPNWGNSALQHLSEQPADVLDRHLLPTDGFFLVVLVGGSFHRDVRELGWEQDARFEPRKGGIARSWAQGFG